MPFFYTVRVVFFWTGLQIIYLFFSERMVSVLRLIQNQKSSYLDSGSFSCANKISMLSVNTIYFLIAFWDPNCNIAGFCDFISVYQVTAVEINFLERRMFGKGVIHNCLQMRIFWKYLYKVIRRILYKYFLHCNGFSGEYEKKGPNFLVLIFRLRICIALGLNCHPFTGSLSV